MAPDLEEMRLRRRVEHILKAFDFAACAGQLKRYGRRPRGGALLKEVDVSERELRALARRLLLQVCRGSGAQVCESGGLLALRTAQGELRLYRVAGEMCG
jgi:hypothetical protein